MSPHDEPKNFSHMVKHVHRLSRGTNSCASMRSSGIIPQLVEIVYACGIGMGTGDDDIEPGVRMNAREALHNIVQRNPNESDRNREIMILDTLEKIHEYSIFLKTLLRSGGEAIAEDDDQHPVAALKVLKKISFDVPQRKTLFEFGALKLIPIVVCLDHAVHGPQTEETKCCNLLREYALKTLSNLICGNTTYTPHISEQKLFMKVMIGLLESAPVQLLQSIACLLRNLAWRSHNIEGIFHDMNTVTALTQAAIKHSEDEYTVKPILSALWNLIENCNVCMGEFCGVNGALAFLVRMLTYESPSKTSNIVEKAGGLLRHVSSHIAECEQYRQILREQNGLSILLQLLKSDSTTVVINACSTLGKLSDNCPIDQKFLIDHGAIPLLRGLITSENAMIAQGSFCILKNLDGFHKSLDQQKIRENSSISLTKNTKNKDKKRKISEVLDSPIGSYELRYPDLESDSNSDSASIQKKQKKQCQTLPDHDLPGPLQLSVLGTCVPDKSNAEELVRCSLEGESNRKMSDKKMHILNNGIKSDQPMKQLSVKASVIRKSASTNDLSDKPSSNFSTTRSVATFSAATENLSSLEIYQRTDSSHSPEGATQKKFTTPPLIQIPASTTPTKKVTLDGQKQGIKLCSAMETPLKYSRRRSMDSLVIGAVGCPRDDNAYVMIYEYNIAESYVISPTPDSPTPNMLHYTRQQQFLMNNINTFHEEKTSPESTCDTIFSDVTDDDEFNIIMEPPKFDEARNSIQLMEVDSCISNNENNNDTIREHDLEIKYMNICTGVNLLKLDDPTDIDVDVDGDVEMSESKDTANAQEMPSEVGGSILPGYLPVGDSMNKYSMENNLCNFSLISGHSNLTNGSSFAGPFPVAPKCMMDVEMTVLTAPALPLISTTSGGLHVQQQQQPQRQRKRAKTLCDSLNLLLTDSDDDTQLPNQAIAGGQKRKMFINVLGITIDKIDNSSTDTSYSDESEETGMYKSNNALSASTRRRTTSLGNHRSSVMGNLQYNANPRSNQHDTPSLSKRRKERMLLHDIHRLLIKEANRVQSPALGQTDVEEMDTNTNDVQ